MLHEITIFLTEIVYHLANNVSLDLTLFRPIRGHSHIMLSDDEDELPLRRSGVLGSV